jgi:hypothetical protein
MTEQHPISPTPELVRQWMNEFYGVGRVLAAPSQGTIDIATRAAQWGWNQREPEIQAAADREREEICHWLRTGPYGASIACHAEQMISDLRAARRPKPPSLKEQAIGLFKHRELHRDMVLNPQDVNTILRALELLPDNPTPTPSNP